MSTAPSLNHRLGFYTDDHEAYRASVREFVKREVEPHYLQWEEERLVPRSAWLWPLAVRGMRAAASAMSRTCISSSRPASVRISPRAWRWKRVVLRDSSSARICRLTADCDRFSLSPAWVRLPASATA